jgi:hypothetical protein
LPTVVAQAQTPFLAPAQAPINAPAHEPTEGDRVRADFMNVIYVPGKALTCGAGALVSTWIMLVSLGSAYRDAVSFYDEGCGGKWALSPYDVMGRRGIRIPLN